MTQLPVAKQCYPPATMPRLPAWIKPCFHWLATVILLAAGLWTAAQETYLLVALMLLLPLLDSGWRPPRLTQTGAIQGLIVALLLLTAIGLLVWKPAQLPFAAATLLTAALPEEWFFRAYLMPRLGRGYTANILTSLIFSLLHGMTRGPMIALQVFVPSLFFGWCYQRTGNLTLVVIAHALSNLVFVLFLARWF